MKKIITVVVLAAVVSSAFAQGGGGGGRGGQRFGMGGGQSELGLLQRKDVQTDLKVTDDQKSKLEALQAKQREEMQGMFQGGGGGGDREAMMKAFEDMNKKAQVEVDKIITKEQKVRLREIRVQLAGNRAVMQEDVQKELGMTEDQKTKLKGLQDKQRDANQSIMEKMRNGEIERDQIQELRQKNDKILDEEIAKVLTDEQKAKLKTMAGAPFKADPQTGRNRPPFAA